MSHPVRIYLGSCPAEAAPIADELRSCRMLHSLVLRNVGPAPSGAGLSIVAKDGGHQLAVTFDAESELAEEYAESILVHFPLLWEERRRQPRRLSGAVVVLGSTGMESAP